MSPVSRPGLPPELDDADWLRRRLATVGTMGIALELQALYQLHVTRYQVRKACEQHGLSQPPGRRRGTQPSPKLAARRGRPAIELIAERLEQEQRPNGPPPTLRLVGKRALALHDADHHGDQLALRDALVSLASACGLVLEHMQLLKAA